MGWRMAKVSTTVLMEINTKVNIKMAKWMAKVFTTMLTAANKRMCIIMDSKWAASGYD
jgi:hypothetical protein